MSVKDMRLSEEEKRDREQETSILDTNEYPYGLRINLDEITYEKVGFEKIPGIGEKFAIVGVVEVVDIHQDKISGDKSKVRVGLQITEMGLEPNEENAVEASELLYT